MPTEELAKYGPTGVAIALILGISYIIPKLLILLKSKDDMFLKFMNESEERHCKAYEKLDATLTGVNITVQENTIFMRNLNGKLEKAIKEKVK